MNKFYKWADKKGYIKIEKNMNSSITIFMLDKNDFPCIPTKQMYIGHMIEYLNYHRSVEIIMKNFEGTSDNLYDYLKKQIEELNK